MVLLEAMSYGVPCISFDCDTGPRHIIQHGETGILVQKENPTALVEAISSLIDDKQKRQELSKRALVRSRDFSSEKTYDLWNRLFLELNNPENW
jgi:glycosyltransferase involved in cell wall biosynthesis